MTTTAQSISIPRVGMFATVRNRRGIVSAVEPFDGEDGRLHLVHLEYKDDQFPADERLLWELEPRKNLLEPTALPISSGTDPMPDDDFNALLRASRWTAASPYLDPDGDGPLDRLPISSPFHGAVQIEDFQLVPLLKALRMPRVKLLIADDERRGRWCRTCVASQNGYFSQAFFLMERLLLHMMSLPEDTVHSAASAPIHH